MSQVCCAVARETFEDNPEALVKRLYLSHKHKQGAKISEEEFNEEYGSSGVSWDPNMTREFADYLSDLHEHRAKNEYIISKGQGGLIEGIAKFGTSVATLFASPTNIALGLIPVFPKTTLMMGAKFGTLAAKTGQAAVASGLAQAATEPLLKAAYSQEQTDYGISNSLSNQKLHKNYISNGEIYSLPTSKLID
ncbi:hypothetical protein [Candidatus Sneabacter namystus]|uniref:Uncharacterized protein n=1 Tax=Candidatus Sneabacter namystus TaxID=2601646 RepID=A0A5C0UIU4_9RICK|nr:hypothetical protein [Candidatus Sneabacter namystus]QEK39362.1 hypothetical protein FZC37_00155 [Candidatus Sneabacter namystus]